MLMECSGLFKDVGGAKAADVAKLIEKVRAEVRRRFNVELEPEVEFVGRWRR